MNLSRLGERPASSESCEDTGHFPPVLCVILNRFSFYKNPNGHAKNMLVQVLPTELVTAVKSCLLMNFRKND